MTGGLTMWKREQIRKQPGLSQKGRGQQDTVGSRWVGHEDGQRAVERRGGAADTRRVADTTPLPHREGWW